MLTKTAKRELLDQLAAIGAKSEAIARKEALRSQFRDAGCAPSVAVSKAWSKVAQEYGIATEDETDPLDVQAKIYANRLLEFLEGQGIRLPDTARSGFEEVVSGIFEDARVGWN